MHDAPCIHSGRPTRRAPCIHSGRPTRRALRLDDRRSCRGTVGGRKAYTTNTVKPTWQPSKQRPPSGQAPGAVRRGAAVAAKPAACLPSQHGQPSLASSAAITASATHDHQGRSQLLLPRPQGNSSCWPVPPSQLTSRRQLLLAGPLPRARARVSSGLPVRAQSQQLQPRHASRRPLGGCQAWPRSLATACFWCQIIRYFMPK